MVPDFPNGKPGAVSPPTKIITRPFAVFFIFRRGSAPAFPAEKIGVNHRYTARSDCFSGKSVEKVLPNTEEVWLSSQV